MMMTRNNPDPLFTIKGDMDSIHSVLFHLIDGSEYLYATTQTGTIYKWDLQTCREVARVQVSCESCLAVKYLGNCYVSQAKGGEFKIWKENNNDWEQITVIISEYWGFCKVDVLSDKFLVCPESDSKVKVLSLEGEVVNTLSSDSNENCGEVMVIKCFLFLKTEYIFVVYESGLLSLFGRNGTKVSEFKITSGCPMALDVDGESKVIVGSSGDVITGLELTSDLTLKKWKEVTITNPGVSCVVIRPDKKLFAVGCWDSRIRLFSMKSFRLLAVLQNHNQSIQDICYSPKKINAWNCQWLLVAAGKDGKMSLWNVY